MKNRGYLSKSEIIKLKLDIGKNNLISRNVRFYSKTLKIGNNCRIDDDVVLKGKVVLKNNIHLARGCTLSGGDKGIFIDNLTAISNYVQMYSGSDDYRREYIPSANLSKKMMEKYSKIYSDKIKIGKAVLIGNMSCLLPGAVFEDFSSCSAYSIVNFLVKSGQFINGNFKKKILYQRDLRVMKDKYLKIMTDLKIDGGHGKN